MGGSTAALLPAVSLAHSQSSWQEASVGPFKVLARRASREPFGLFASLWSKAISTKPGLLPTRKTACGIEKKDAAAAL